jgi:hypothetical protein
VGLSLNVGRLNGGVTDALYLGAVLPGVVRGIEDHGYSLTFGIKVPAFLMVILGGINTARLTSCRD